MIGSYASCRERVEEYWTAGVDTIVLGTQMGRDPGPTIESFAELAKEIGR